MPASSLPFLLYETLVVGEVRDGGPNLLSMVPVRWLGIAYLHAISLTTASTQYASTTSMYLLSILLSLQKLLCCSSVVLGVSFFVVLRIEYNLGVLIFIYCLHMVRVLMMMAHGSCKICVRIWISMRALPQGARPLCSWLFHALGRF
jgi:hypothetical protein